jgi:hypothetical protein
MAIRNELDVTFVPAPLYTHLLLCIVPLVVLVVAILTVAL